MLRHHLSEPYRSESHQSETSEQYAVEPSVAATERASEIQTPEINHYLDQVKSHLSAVPPEVRESVCREMRQHLTERLAAHLELGTDPEEALRATLGQFGKAETIARRFQKAWKQVEGRALWTGPLPRWITSVVMLWLFTLPLTLMLSGQQPITRDIPSLAPVLNVLVPLFLIVLPIAFGVSVGRNRSHRIGRGLFNTALLLTLPVLAVAVITNYSAGYSTSGSGIFSSGYARSPLEVLEVWMLGWALGAVARHLAARLAPKNKLCSE